ncbi:MAG: Bax inhibitor-1/YccA family protein [Bacteroidales bacterium]
MANPVLSEKLFMKEASHASNLAMTIKGTIYKTLILLLMVMAGASYTWKVFNESISPNAVNGWMWGGAVGGFIVAMFITFKPSRAQYIAPLYALLQGLFLGALSAMFNGLFAELDSNIVLNAVLLTIAATFSMLLIYRSGIIKVDSRFTKLITIAVGAIAFYYIISIVLSLFKVNLTLLHDSGPLSIGVSLIIVLVASFSLLVDFEFIVRGSSRGLPKYMEWYGAFSLMVTLIWLYLEILKLLSKFAARRE